MRRIIFVIVVITVALLGCEKVTEQKPPVAGNKLYIPQGYEEQLTALNLTEVVSLPYFSKPFICIAKDTVGQQYAVIFYSSDSAKTVKLPVLYEEILKKIESQGFNVKNGTVYAKNLHLFEIDKSLFWNFEDGTGKIYLTLNGEVTDPFMTS